jgi:hypothetical protein
MKRRNLDLARAGTLFRVSRGMVLLGQDRGQFGSGGVRSFPPPDPSKLSPATLTYRNLFERLLLTLRDLSHARSALTFISEEADFGKKYSLADLRRFNCYEIYVYSFIWPPILSIRLQSSEALIWVASA